MKLTCPDCGEKLERRALVDSDDRVQSTWLFCHSCRYDSRKEPVHHQQTQDGK